MREIRRGRRAELLAPVMYLATGCGPSVVLAEEVGAGMRADGGPTGAGSTGAPKQPDSPPDSGARPDEPEPHPICGRDESYTYTFTVEEYTEQLSAVLDGWSCDEGGDPGFDDGTAGDPTGGTQTTGGSTSTGTTGAATWDDIPLACGVLCSALTCEDELVPNECLSVTWTECGWSDPNEDGERTMTCCYNTTDGCP